MKIAICGSMAFTEQMFEAKEQLEKLGHQAVVSGFGEKYLGKTPEEIEKLKLYHKYEKDAIREFYEEIKNADAILVLNYDRKGIENYIGGNTLMEIGFAHVLNKKIFLLNPIPDIEFYKTEIEATRPVILDGDLEKIESKSL
ncbi:MAG: Maf-like protein [Microgenomates group bacterium GW2011_GWA1_Microgenomates_45_10]|nr:MAG: Maf-like protein [Microgenomates group bacterium GW2011_GWA1_Microgenomates_45_10]